MKAIAEQVVEHLNNLIKDPEVREHVGRFLLAKVVCSEAVQAHPQITVDDAGMLGLLGVLNGAFTDPEHNYVIASVLDESGQLVKFAVIGQ